jgi:glycosyltransferase involved in cell wall biosynthesis
LRSTESTSLQISVLIPAWNEESYICDALESVAAQSRLPDELIVVDDGSSDCTGKLVRDWSARRGIEVELIRQIPAGVASARNRGLRHTRADLVALLDADDLFLPHHLERAEAAFQHHPDLVLCFADVDVLSQQRVLRRSFLADKRHESLDTEIGTDGLRLVTASPYMSLIRGNYIPVSTSVYRVTTLRSIGLFDETLINAADRDINLRLSRHGHFAYYPTPSARMRQRADSLSVVDPLRAQRDRFRVVEKMLEHRGELVLSHEEVAYTRKALSCEARSLLNVASHNGWSTYRDVVRFLGTRGFMSAAFHPLDLLRVIANAIGFTPRGMP